MIVEFYRVYWCTNSFSSSSNTRKLFIFPSVGLIRRAPAVQCYTDDVCSNFPIDFSSLLVGISWTVSNICYENVGILCKFVLKNTLNLMVSPGLRPCVSIRIYAIIRSYAGKSRTRPTLVSIMGVHICHDIIRGREFTAFWC